MTTAFVRWTCIALCGGQTSAWEASSSCHLCTTDRHKGRREPAATSTPDLATAYSCCMAPAVVQLARNRAWCTIKVSLVPSRGFASLPEARGQVLPVTANVPNRCITYFALRHADLRTPKAKASGSAELIACAGNRKLEDTMQSHAKQYLHQGSLLEDTPAAGKRTTLQPRVCQVQLSLSESPMACP